ncbi:unnamed protein product [Vitrella brassicaformis CCMP3155]|uniref:Uncharacterized protein n=1 Tax=Vitrella brassicaformis (strain CCMP3155) TaxID=1169540 RepID=A0A0G4EED8_VITBC|nr:unnamed protein product [Vitrella brassicaformis CCMP3155]|eukprot:CEL94358.1 unnamed protein product [Vitrella brassicaformis CCMP3155]
MKDATTKWLLTSPTTKPPPCPVGPLSALLTAHCTRSVICPHPFLSPSGSLFPGALTEKHTGRLLAALTDRHRCRVAVRGGGAWRQHCTRPTVCVCLSGSLMASTR